MNPKSKPSILRSGRSKDSQFTGEAEAVPDALQRARHSYRSWLRQVSDAGAVPGRENLWNL